MPRTVTVTLDDGTKHTYQNIPDSVTPDQVSQRALADFKKPVTHIDGGNASVQSTQEPPPQYGTNGSAEDIPIAPPASPEEFAARQAAIKQPTYLDRVLGTGGQIIDSLGGLQDKAVDTGFAIAQHPISSLKAAGSIVSSGTTGLLGQAMGFGHGAYSAAKSGTLGTTAGNNAIAQEQSDAGKRLTYTPEDPTAQKYVQNVGEALEPLANAAPFTHELGVIGQSAKAMQAAKPVVNAVIPAAKVEKLNTIKKILNKETDNDLAKVELKVENPTLKDAKGKLLPEAYKIVDDEAGIEASKQGIRDGSIATIKTADDYNAKIMQKMTETSEKAKGNDRYSVDNRPSNHIGDEIVKDYHFIEAKNKKAGEAIDKEAKQSLKGVTVDVSKPVDEFINTLSDELNVEIVVTPSGKIIPKFKGSHINLTSEKKERQFIKNIIDDLQNAGDPDALNVHNFKRAIDSRVVYGKDSSMNPTVERAVKKLRRGLDTELDNNFPAYNKANIDYAETIDALGQMRDIAGKKLDWHAPGAAKQAGILTKGLTSDIKSGQALTNALDTLQSTARKHGLESKADIKALAAYSNELDRRFGSHGATNFGGSIASATKGGDALAIAKAGSSAASGHPLGVLSAANDIKNRFTGVNDKAAYDSLRKLIAKQRAKKGGSK